MNDLMMMCMGGIMRTSGTMMQFRIAVAIAFWFGLISVGFAASFEDDFLLLAERCRTAIEQAKQLDTSGLTPYSNPSYEKKFARKDVTGTVWEIDGDSSWYLVSSERLRKDGRSYRGCDVFVKERYLPVGKVQQALLIRAFLELKLNLLFQQTHKEDEGMMHVPPLLLLGFVQVGQNERGCSTVNGLSLSFDGTFVQYFVGEKDYKSY